MLKTPPALLALLALLLAGVVAVHLKGVVERTPLRLLRLLPKLLLERIAHPAYLDVSTCIC